MSVLIKVKNNNSMIVSIRKSVFHGILLGTIFHVLLFQFVIQSTPIMLIFFTFSSSKFFFCGFLSKLFVKALNSTENSRKMYSFKVYRYVLLSSAMSYIIIV